MFGIIISLLASVQIGQSAYVLPASTLPPTPVLPTPREYGYVNLSTVDIWYAQFGPTVEECQQSQEYPIVFLHGGFANSDYWGNQVASLLEYSPYATVITLDSRMQGRSTGIHGPISYDLMREDVVGVLDYFGIPKATIVGWSDGGIIGLDLAINAPERLNRLFAFAASYIPSNIQPTISQSPVWDAYTARTKQEYMELSPTPNDYHILTRKINNMFQTLPDYGPSDFARIPTLYDNCETSPLIWIVDSADEEAIKYHVARTMHNWIPASGLVIMPGVSHFAFIQDPWTFNIILGRFLSYGIDCSGTA